MLAKQVILQNVDNSLISVIQPHSRKRIGDNKVDRTVVDILSIVAIVDENDCRHLLPTFCASSLSCIPVMPDDMSELAAIRSELSDLRRQFNNLMSTVETAVKCTQVAQQPPLSVQAPTQPTHGSGSTSHDEVSTDINDDASRSDDVSDDDQNLQAIMGMCSNQTQITRMTSSVQN